MVNLIVSSYFHRYFEVNTCSLRTRPKSDGDSFSLRPTDQEAHTSYFSITVTMLAGFLAQSSIMATLAGLPQAPTVPDAAPSLLLHQRQAMPRASFCGTANFIACRRISPYPPARPSTRSKSRNPARSYPPLRFLDGTDISSKNMAKLLSDFQCLFGALEKELRDKAAWIDGPTEAQAAQMFTISTEWARLAAPGKTDRERTRRVSQIAWSTLLNLSPQPQASTPMQPPLPSARNAVACVPSVLRTVCLCLSVYVCERECACVFVCFVAFFAE